ncbi:MAG: hypothetical protein ACLFM5_04600 [Spirochaetaceae bacterium]
MEEAVERLSWLPIIRRLDIDPLIEGRRILSSMAGLSARLATGLGEVASGIGSFLLGAFI